jgi:formylglycine-generating enzyme required for sulfatase activity
VPHVFVNSIGMRFALIPRGSFVMGAGDSFQGDAGYERPAHPVDIGAPFYISTTLVTQVQWQEIAGANPSFHKGGGDSPVDSVSYEDVLGFIRLLNEREGSGSYRLPTEAEWEYAARAGSRSRYCFGDEEGLLESYAWYGADVRGGGPRPVGGKLPNAWGLFDVHGNLFEWTADWFAEGYYASSPRRDPQGPAGGEGRVTRGGSYASDAWFCQTAARNSESPEVRSMFTGFRLARGIR